MSWLWRYVTEATIEGLYDQRGCVGGIVARIPRKYNVTIPAKKKLKKKGEK